MAVENYPALSDFKPPLTDYCPMVYTMLHSHSGLYYIVKQWWCLSS